MSSTYDGNAANFPLSITIPSDGDGPGIKAADVNTAFEGLADRTAFLGLSPALNWFPKITVGAEDRWALHVTPTADWLVIGGDAGIKRSSSDAAEFAVDFAPITTGAIPHADTDDSGNIVRTIDTGATAIREYDASTATWSPQTVDAAIDGFASVVFDPVNAKWCLIAHQGGGGAGWYPYTSPDRVTWTVHSIFTGLTARPQCMAVRKDTGKIVAMFESGGTISPRTSADGGVTWASPSNLTSTIASATEWSLSFNDKTNQWLFTIGETSGTHSSEVWVSSNDGASWTAAATLANYCMLHCAPDYRGAWVGVARHATRSEVVYSIDGGVTWVRAGVSFSGTPRGVFSGGSTLVLVTSTNVYRSLRVGSPGVGNLT